MDKIKAQTPEREIDPRTFMTKQIWSYATGMVALCVIFALTRNAIYPPVLIALSAAASTVFVWKQDMSSNLRQS
jgi:hypothetical protein